jgi:hypothetical protein
MHQKVQKTFDTKCLTLSKENQKSQIKTIRFGRSKSPVKGSNLIRLLYSFDALKKVTLLIFLDHPILYCCIDVAGT